MNFEERLVKFAEGEKTRRALADKWLWEAAEKIKMVARDIWGEGDCSSDGPTYTIDLDQYYFDYPEYDSDILRATFRVYNDGNSGPVCNKDGYVEDLRGREFWEALQVIAQWVDSISPLLEDIEREREKKLRTLNIGLFPKL